MRLVRTLRAGGIADGGFSEGQLEMKMEMVVMVMVVVCVDVCGGGGGGGDARASVGGRRGGKKTGLDVT